MFNLVLFKFMHSHVYFPPLNGSLTIFIYIFTLILILFPVICDALNYLLIRNCTDWRFSRLNLKLRGESNKNIGFRLADAEIYIFNEILAFHSTKKTFIMSSLFDFIIWLSY